MDSHRQFQSTYPEILPNERPEEGEPFVLQVSVQLPEPTHVHILEDKSTTIPYTVNNVSHLPPLRLTLLLPPTYPLELPPVIHSLDCIHDWLTPATIRLSKERLLTLWDRENVLGIWIDHIRNGELLSSLNLAHSSPPSIK